MAAEVVRAASFFLAWLSVLLVGACAHTPRASLGVRERDWRAVRTDRVTLYTDLDDARAREQARTLERLLSAYAQAGWGAASERRLSVVMFEHATDFAPFAREGVEGYFVRDLLAESWIVLPAPRFDGTLRSLAALEHELSHHVLHGTLREQPAWFAEGIATYFESAHFVRKDEFMMGGAPSRRLQEVLAHGLMPTRRLLAGDTRAPGFYGSAWLFAHYLIAERAQDFARFHELVRVGVPWERAFARVFPDLTASALERALKDYLQRGQFATHTFKVRRPAFEPRVDLLTRADLRALLAALLMENSRAPDPRGAHALFMLALAEDPEQSLARAYAESGKRSRRPTAH